MRAIRLAARHPRERQLDVVPLVRHDLVAALGREPIIVLGIVLVYQLDLKVGAAVRSRDVKRIAYPIQAHMQRSQASDIDRLLGNDLDMTTRVSILNHVLVSVERHL